MPPLNVLKARTQYVPRAVQSASIWCEVKVMNLLIKIYINCKWPLCISSHIECEWDTFLMWWWWIKYIVCAHTNRTMAKCTAHPAHNRRGKFKYLIGWKLTRQISALSKVNAPHCLALERMCTNFRCIHCYSIRVHRHSLTRSASPLGFSYNFHVCISIEHVNILCWHSFNVQSGISHSRVNCFFVQLTVLTSISSGDELWMNGKCRRNNCIHADPCSVRVVSLGAAPHRSLFYFYPQDEWRENAGAFLKEEIFDSNVIAQAAEQEHCGWFIWKIDGPWTSQIWSTQFNKSFGS